MTNCDLKEGDELVTEGTGRMPERLRPHAWQSIFKNVHLLTWGGGYPKSLGEGLAFGVCSDGLRPVIFRLERIESD